LKRIFLDTEFTDLNRNTYNIISLGMVELESKRGYYIEFTDTYWTSECSQFVKETVLPLLNAGKEPNLSRMNSMEAVDAMYSYLASFDDDIEFMVDAPHWDYPLVIPFIEQFKDKLNKTIVFSNYVVHDLDRAEAHVRISDRLFETMRRHHAFDDAYVAATLFEQLSEDFEVFQSFKIFPTSKGN
jgi:DNA polymerase III epsilon subunit-like protein